MATDTWLLMKLYWTLDRRAGSGLSLGRILVTIVAVFGGLVMGVFSAFAGWGISLLAVPDHGIGLAPGLFPGLLLTFVLLGVLFTGLNQSMKSLYLSGDLDRLMVAPIHTRSIMVAKLLSRLPWSLLLLFLLAGPAFLAYGIGLRAGPIYYLAGGAMLLFAPLFGLSLGAVLAMLLVRWLPVNRLNELMTAAYALVGIIIAILFQLPRLFINSSDGATVEIDGGEMGAALAGMQATIDRLPLPTLWAGRGLMALDAGALDWQGVLGIAIYLALTIGLFTLVLLTTDRLYLSGWLKTQSVSGKRRGLESSGRGAFGGRSLARAIGTKDWLMRLRDPRQLVSLFGTGFMAVVIGGLALFGGQGGATSMMEFSATATMDGPAIQRFFTAAIRPSVFFSMYAFFVGYVFLSNMASYALPLEGSAFPLLKAAPIRPREVWSAKLLGVYLPFAAVFAVALAITWLVTRFSLLWMPYALAMGLLAGYGLIAINVSAGFRYANMEWTDPRRMMTQTGGFVSLILTVIYSFPASIVAVSGFALALSFPNWALLFAAIALLALVGLTAVTHALMAMWADVAWKRIPV